MVGLPTAVIADHKCLLIGDFSYFGFNSRYKMSAIFVFRSLFEQHQAISRHLMSLFPKK